MAQYDAMVIQQFADGLYTQAQRIAISGAVGGALVGGAAGGVCGALMHIEGFLLLLGLAAGGLFGYSMGRARGFSLRLQAQQALCMVQIEANTRLSLEHTP